MMARVLEEFKPDCVNIHVINGIGYNALYEIGKRDIASVYFMRDLSLVCAKAGFFNNGKDCVSRCRIRFLFVGRIHMTKGVHLLLEALEGLAESYRFTLTIVGTGPEEVKLRARYGSRLWCAFAGFVQREEVSNFMALSDALCMPSTMRENSPGVIIHALSQGLPVIGSNKGAFRNSCATARTDCLFPQATLSLGVKL